MSGEPNRRYESMTRVQHGGLTVRVWRTEESHTYGPNEEIEKTIRSVHIWPNPHSTSLLISRALDGLPNIAAYEILDGEGHGAIVYPDWK